MACDPFDNFPKEQDAPSAPDKGVNTGVTDTYGGGLKEGYQSPEKINTTPFVGGVDFA